MRHKQMSVGRSAAHDFDRAFYLLTGSKSSNSVGDSLTPGGDTKRISRAKARAIGDRLTDNDRQVIDLLQTVELASGNQVRFLVWGKGDSAARSARRQLAKLTALRVLARLPYRPGGLRTGHDSYVYLLDVVGQHLTGGSDPRRPQRPVVSNIEHTLGVTDCYLTLRRLDRHGHADLIHFDAEPNCWRDFAGPGGARQLLKPDAFVILGVGDWEYRWFLEIDRDTERPHRIRRKADVYIRYWQSGREQSDSDIFPKILWAAPDRHRAEQITRTLSRLPADKRQLFQVTTVEHFADSIVASGPPEVDS